MCVQFVDGFYFGVPGMAQKATDDLWAEAHSIAAGVRNNAFSYLDYDPEDPKFDGSNAAILTSDQALDVILNGQAHGHNISAGSLTGFDQY